MDNWNDINRTSPFGVRPEPPYISFLRRWHGEERFTRILEIGPGRNLRNYLPAAHLGFDVVSVDISHAVAANYHGDVRNLGCQPDFFDIVTDIKSLCHDPNPPYEEIHRWLKPGGYLFCVMPSNEHLTQPDAYPIAKPADRNYEYEFVRMATREDVQSLFPMFSMVKVFHYTAELLGGHYKVYNWCIEARK